MVRAVIPAAGASRRMGRPKLLLPFAGGTVVGAVAEALRAGGAQSTVLVVAPAAKALIRHAAELGLIAAVNPEPERGMLSSVWVGLEALGGAAAFESGDCLLVTPGDLPALRPDTVRRLVEAVSARGAAAAVPTYRARRGHPLALGAGPVRDVPELDPTVGLRQILERCEAAEIAVDDPGVLADIDTPQDYEAARGDDVER